MGLREESIRRHPGFPWLDADDEAGIASYLESRGFTQEGEEFIRCERAGEGNMNLTLRIHTSARRFILKQARPWVEKYPEIAAPWDRSLSELRFYERATTIPSVATRMPHLIACERADRVLLLEDLAGARDFTSLYAKDRDDADSVLQADEVDALGAYLAALHSGTRGIADEELANREMRQLNHAHIFVIPLDPTNGLDLDALEPGLADAAFRLINDDDYRRRASEAGDRYLADGPCLVHGDYFPGSWLRTTDGLKVIDPEFSFLGDPEVDLGCAIAHFALAEQSFEVVERFLASYTALGPKLDSNWLGRYAAVEVMRRLIGVAQLPLGVAARGEARSQGPRGRLLEKSRGVMAGNPIRDLF